MPPKKNNKNAKKAGKAKDEEPEIQERVEDEEEDVQYDSDGNEIVKEKAVEAESSAPGKPSAREIQKLKKKKQKGQLTDEELALYGEYLQVEDRYVLLGTVFWPCIITFPHFSWLYRHPSVLKIRYHASTRIGRDVAVEYSSILWHPSRLCSFRRTDSFSDPRIVVLSVR